ncbi:peptide ABC transporter substrate-binding protein [Mesocricetibacter intestinalis]|nr:peptide ABC transporter substrate-binding protein [Mesocricetibacter intestinalis]
MLIFLLSACDPVPHDKSPATASDKAAAATKPAIPVLTRAVYSDLVLNPTDIQNEEQVSFLRDLFEGLTIFDPQGNVIPGAASHWYTEDNKIWFFKLRPEAKWSNGEPVSAEDFVLSWQALARSAGPLKNYLSFMHLENALEVAEGKMPVQALGIHAPEPFLVQIKLDKPLSYLPKMLTHAALLPRYRGEATNPVANGAYGLVEQRGDLIRLEKNSFYPQQENIYFTRVDYRKIGTGQDLGAADLVVSPAPGTENTQLFPRLCSYFYEFNFRDALMAKSAVRKALVSMISPAAILRDEKLAMMPSNSVLPRNMQPESDTQWQASVVEQLLQQAGISAANPLRFKLSYDQVGIHPAIANRLIQAWSQSDLIRVEAQPLSWTQLQEKRNKGDFQVIRSGWCADYNDASAFFHLFRSGSPDNKTGFANQELDQLSERLSNEIIEPQAVTDILRRISDLIRRERVVLPIFQYNKAVYIKEGIAGYELSNPTETLYSKDLYRLQNRPHSSPQH